MYIQTYNSMTH